MNIFKKIKASKRGLTFSGKELERADLAIGSNFSIEINTKLKKVTILKKEDGRYKVSRKKVGDNIKPLIDIRKKEIVEQFQGKEKIIVKFFKGYIEVIAEGVKETFKSNLPLNLQLFSVIKAISMFSGAGMLDKSFVDNGFEIVWANEMDKAAVQTYKKNIGDHIVQGDITQIKKDTIPEAKVLIAGFPCVAFSSINRSETRGENHHAAFLFREVIETAITKNIDIVAMENVAEFKGINKGLFFKELKEEFERNGYSFSYEIVTDVDYGGFSDRKRILMIASKLGEITIPKKTFWNAPKTILDAFKENIRDNSPNTEDYSKSKPETVEKMSFIPQGGNWKNIPSHLKVTGTFSNYMRRLNLKETSPTIVNPRKSIILSPLENRIVSVRECAAIMGMPHDFEFLGNLNEKQQQVANGVTKAIGNGLAKLISTFIRRKQND